MKYDYDREVTPGDIIEVAEFMMGTVGFKGAMEIPEMLSDDFAVSARAILAYRDQAEGKVLNLRPELREVVNHLTEILVEFSRGVDAETTEDQIREGLSPLLDALADAGVPEEALEKAVKLTTAVTETLVELVGDEEHAVEVYNQLDPAFAPFAILAYRKQADGYEFAPGELEPEVRKEVDRLTEILAELSRHDAEESEDDTENELPPEVKARIDRLVKSLEKAFGNVDAKEDEIDHYEDYRIKSGYSYQWDDEEDFEDEEAHQRLHEDIVRAAHKRQGYVLATREVWAKPVAQTEDGRWIFETEYGLEYLDFEDYGFEPEFEDEESYVDFD